LIGDEVTVGGPGTCAFKPRGVRHAWKSTGAETVDIAFDRLARAQHVIASM
jgi:hypothetical protein